jgi:hypothetical protein
MRQILVDHARGHGAAKRGYGRKVELKEAIAYSSERSEDLVLFREMSTSAAVSASQGS